MRTIAVTGAQGFLGSATVNKLQRLGYKVIPIVRQNNGLYPDAIEWDITHSQDNVFPDVDVVIHSAAKVDDWASYSDTYTTNVLGTQNVIAAFPNATLFVYISSASVYDPKNTEVIITEESAAGNNLLNGYSRTKFEAEGVVIKGTQSSRVVLRPHIIYGPGDTHILPRLLKARKFGRFLILGNGKNNVSLTHIDNLTDAIALLVSSNKRFNGEIFNITDDTADPVESVINTLKDALNITEKNFHIPLTVAYAVGIIFEFLARVLKMQRSPLITPYIVKQMTSNHVIDCSKAKRMFGYDPLIKYREGFKKL